MKLKRKHSLIVIENGMLTVYSLDDKIRWDVGRLSADNEPDIILHSSTVSRKHGYFKNIDGSWFYVDNHGKNGTVYNGKHVSVGIQGRIKPILLKDRDVLVFGGGAEAVVSSKTIWSVFTEFDFGDEYAVQDSKGLTRFVITDGDASVTLEHPQKGTMISQPGGFAVYMGDVTFLIGHIALLT